MFEKLVGRKPGIIDENKIKQYAVTVPLIKRENGYNVLFEIRSANLDRQPGEICFPGGKREGDETAEQNAIRETCEELAISPTQIEVIAQMDTLVTGANRNIDVFLCELKDYKETFDSSEVGDVFEVPLDYFLNTKPEKYTNRQKMILDDNFPIHKIPDGNNYKWSNRTYDVYFYYYNDYVIWGMTANIMRNVAETILTF